VKIITDIFSIYNKQNIMAYISLSQLKEQLNIEQEFVSDDGYLTQLISN